MEEYSIEITETLSRTIKIKAKDLNEAFYKVLEDYKNGDIVLNENDLKDYLIEPI